jgi:acyl carrier protein
MMMDPSPAKERVPCIEMTSKKHRQQSRDGLQYAQFACPNKKRTQEKAMSRDDIFEKIQKVLDDALGVDEDEVTPEASLTADLGAESIDFLDIVFRLEKTFDFKISQGELFPENLTENEAWVSDGKLTDEGLAMLRDQMTHVDFDSFAAGDRDLSNIGDLITVNSLVNFVELKLNG